MGRNTGRSWVTGPPTLRTALSRSMDALREGESRFKQAGVFGAPTAPWPSDSLMRPGRTSDSWSMGGGVHNVAYARNALGAAKDKINQAMALINDPYRMDEIPALPETDVEMGGTSCPGLPYGPSDGGHQDP